MMISVGETPVYEETFDSTMALVDQYRDHELERGQVLPKYSFEALSFVVGAWLLGKVGDHLFQLVVEYRKQKQERTEKQELRTIAERRHQELMERLNQIIDEQKPPGANDAVWLRNLLSRADLAIEIRIDTDAEADFADGIRHQLVGLRESQVEVQREREV